MGWDLWVCDLGLRSLGLGGGALDLGLGVFMRLSCVFVFGFRVQDLGFRIRVYRFQDLGNRVQGSL